MKATIDPKIRPHLDDFIERALYEDAPEGDHTSLACIPADARSKAKLIIKDVGIVAGIAIAECIIKKLDETATVNVLIQDGKPVHYGDIVMEIEANSRAILKGERLLLNIMQRMSGIATLASRFAFETEDLSVTVLDTRKTTPLIRFLEKMAVRLGGCQNYRDNLSEWFMIKDNHVDACGGIREAIEQVNAYQKEKGLNLGITIEVRNLVELYEVLTVGKVTRIMLDNFELPLLEEAIATIDGEFETEASGGINIHNVRKVAQTGVNFISVGALTHSAQSLDMSLKVSK